MKSGTIFKMASIFIVIGWIFGLALIGFLIWVVVKLLQYFGAI